MPKDLYLLYLRAYAQAVSGYVFSPKDFLTNHNVDCSPEQIAAIVLGIESARDKKRLPRIYVLNETAKLAQMEATAGTQ